MIKSTTPTSFFQLARDQFERHESLNDERLLLKNRFRNGNKSYTSSFIPVKEKSLTAEFKNVLKRIAVIPPTVSAFITTIISLILYYNKLESVIWIFLSVGFLTLGLSHGAVDHWADHQVSGRNQQLKFVLKYLAKSAALGLIWFILPDAAFFCFIAYSAWHFGQADFTDWKIKNGIVSFLWGTAVIMLILSFHFEETISVLKHIPGLKITDALEKISSKEITALNIFVVVGSLAIMVYRKSWYMFLCVSYLLLLSQLPLLIAFGIYFVVQHSFHGWKHLKIVLKTNSYDLWLKSLPFSIGGAALILLFMLTNTGNQIGLFFIALSCISIPHVVSMDHFYGKNKISELSSRDKGQVTSHKLQVTSDK